MFLSHELLEVAYIYYLVNHFNNFFQKCLSLKFSIPKLSKLLFRWNQFSNCVTTSTLPQISHDTTFALYNLPLILQKENVRMLLSGISRCYFSGDHLRKWKQKNGGENQRGTMRELVKYKSPILKKLNSLQFLFLM